MIILLLICFRFVNSNSPSPGMGELNIYPPGGQPTTGATPGKESTNGANLHICFSENSRFRVLMKNGTFLCKIRNFCTASVTYKYNPSMPTSYSWLTTSTGQWPTRKSYKNRFLFQKEHGRPSDFCGAADKVGRAYHTCIICHTCILLV